MKTPLLRSWRPLGLCTLSAGLYCVALQPANAQLANAQPANAQPANAQNKTFEEYLNQLKSANARQRREAFQQLAAMDDLRQISVLKLLNELKKNPDHSYGSSFVMTLRVVGAMRIRGALIDLRDVIDFQLDPATFPVGGFMAPISFYPVAQTVIELNEWPETIELVTNRFGSTASDTTLRVYTYVLKEVLGEKWSRRMVQSNLDRRKASLLITPNSIVDKTTITNLEGALKLLDGEDEILKEPSMVRKTPG